jgi:hypothetical protein
MFFKFSLFKFEEENPDKEKMAVHFELIKNIIGPHVKLIYLLKNK